MRAWVSLLLLLTACGGGPRGRVAAAADRGDVEGALEAYERVRASEGPDRDLLARIAAVILLREAREGEEGARRAALLQLSLAGTRGGPLLRELADDPGVGPARRGALKVLARRGDEASRLALRALADHDDLEVVEASVLGMDAELDRGLLLELLASTHAGVRAAAAGALRPLADQDDVRGALAMAARVDPEPSVRAASARALGRGGVGAVDALRERLSDPSSTVRLAAVGALVEVGDARGLEALGALLEVDPSPAGIEAARLLAQGDDPAGATAARTFLRQTLRSTDAGLRAQAGVALAGLPAGAESPLPAVAEALAQEEDATVRLALARALLRGDAPAARAALEGLLEADGMPAVQAAAILAADGHDRARRALLSVFAADDASVLLRRTAVRALAREAMEPDAVRRALTDDEVEVRIYAAGGILAAAAAP